MYPAIIESYQAPKTIEEAQAAMLAANGEAMYIAGGMSLMQALKSRVLACKVLIDLQHVSELKGVECSREVWRIGAMTRYREIAESDALEGAYGALVDAAAHVGDRQVRNRGTVGGSLAWNFILACMPVASLACDVKISVLRADGKRQLIPIDDFLQGPMTTSLDEGDLLLGLEMAPPTDSAGSAYCKWGIVKDALPTVGVAAYVELSPTSTCTQARIAVGGLSSGPKRAASAEARLKSIDLREHEAVEECARIAARECEFSDDPWLSAKYKSQLAEQLCVKMITRAFERARSKTS